MPLDRGPTVRSLNRSGPSVPVSSTCAVSGLINTTIGSYYPSGRAKETESSSAVLSIRLMGVTRARCNKEFEADEGVEAEAQPGRVLSALLFRVTTDTCLVPP